MTLGLDPVDLGVAAAGIAAASLGLAIMRDQRVGVHLAGAAGRDGVAAGDVELLRPAATRCRNLAWISDRPCGLPADPEERSLQRARGPPSRTASRAKTS